MRLGDKNGAADIINSIRKRNFEGGNDPDPVTAANLDKYRMLKEWMQEFLREARRRTDLIRWDAYVTEVGGIIRLRTMRNTIVIHCINCHWVRTRCWNRTRDINKLDLI